MGYLFLAIALFAGSLKGYCGKKVSGAIDGFKDAMLTNFIRMIFCIFIGFLTAIVICGIKALGINSEALISSFISGVTTAGFVIFWLISVKNGSYVMLDIFLMLGVIVTTVMCRIFFKEAIAIKQCIGFAVLIIAAYLMCSYNISLKGKFTFKSFLLLVLCGVSNGLTGFSQKMYVYMVPKGDSSVFNFYTYVFAALVLSVSYFICLSKDKDASLKADMKLAKNMTGIIFIMSVCLFANSYFLVLAAKSIPSAVLYPLVQGAALILSGLMAAFLFKEKPNAKSIAGMITAFIGLLIINL